MKLLLVEDELRMADALRELLTQEGYEVEVQTDGLAALSAVEQGSYDIIILDIMLPRISGLEIARDTRRLGIKTPILMLTAKSDTDDKVVGLDSGADDYLTKPFETKELLARLRALTRRNDSDREDSYDYGDISVSKVTFWLHCKSSGQSVRLSKREFRIIELFMNNLNKIVTRDDLAKHIWGGDAESEYNNVEVYLSFTRRKLEFVKSNVEIRAIRGVGYELMIKHV